MVYNVVGCRQFTTLLYDAMESMGGYEVAISPPAGMLKKHHVLKVAEPRCWTNSLSIFDSISIVYYSRTIVYL